MSPGLVWMVATAVCKGMGTFSQSYLQAPPLRSPPFWQDGGIRPIDREGITVSVSRKRKKELRKLQEQASKLWESQQVLLGESANVAREAGRQPGNFAIGRASCRERVCQYG